MLFFSDSRSPSTSLRAPSSRLLTQTAGPAQICLIMHAQGPICLCPPWRQQKAGGAAATTKMWFFITNLATWVGCAGWTSSNIKGASGIQLWGVTSANTGALVCPACLWNCCLCWKFNSTPISHKPPETQAGSSSDSSSFASPSEAGAQLKLHSFEGTSTEETLTLFSE